MSHALREDRPAVAVVTVNYNHGTYLANYIESLRQSTYPIAEIIIVDNASTDDSLATLARYPEVLVIANPENIGYSAALNQVFRHARSPLICATGPDLVVEPDWLVPLVEQYQRDPEGTFVVASHVLTMDRREIQSSGGSLHFTGHLCVYDMWRPASEDRADSVPREVGAVDSTSMLVDRAKFLSIGGCDPQFFVYHEEFDYCYRARMRGWRCWYDPRSRAYHGDGSQEFSVRSGGGYPRRRPFLHTRNRLLSILKNYQARTLLAIFPALLLIELITVIMLARMGLHGAYGEALCWLWCHRKDIMLKRAAVQPGRKLNDGALLSADALTITPLLLRSRPLRFAKISLDGALALYWMVARKLLYA